MKNALALRFQQEIRPKIKEELGLPNIFSVPKLSKISISVSSGEYKSEKELLEKTKGWLSQISGQKPKVAKARISVASFNVREGEIVGLSVTLRGDRMYDFFQKIVTIVLPKVKDFQGVKNTAFDKQGNYNLGLTEQIIFPEVDYDKIGKITGLNISISTTAKDPLQARALLTALGMPFAK